MVLFYALWNLLSRCGTDVPAMCLGLRPKIGFFDSVGKWVDGSRQEAVAVCSRFFALIEAATVGRRAQEHFELYESWMPTSSFLENPLALADAGAEGANSNSSSINQRRLQLRRNVADDVFWQRKVWAVKVLWLCLVRVERNSSVAGVGRAQCENYIPGIGEWAAGEVRDGWPGASEADFGFLVRLDALLGEGKL